MVLNKRDHMCRWCGESSFRLMESAKDFDADSINFELLKCLSCGLVHTEPFLTGSELATYYSSSYYGSCKAKFTSLTEKMVSSLNVVRARMVFGRLKTTPQPRLLDVGSGRGGFLKAICRYGVECCGTERNEFPQDSDLPFKMYREDLGELSLLPGQFDAVTFWHVLEHLENPGEALAAAGRLLKSNGWLVVAVPDYASLQAKLFGKYWFHLDLPRHLHHFESDWLCDILTSYGYDLEIVRFAEIDQSLFGFIQSCQNKFLKGIKPNSFYRLLQRRTGLKDSVKFLFLLLITVFIFPFACLEFLLASCARKNCSFVVMARKRDGISLKENTKD